MTLDQLVGEVADEFGFLTRKSTKQILRIAFRKLQERVVEDKKRILVPGFGVFYVKETRAHRVVAPSGSEHHIQRVLRVGFRASKHSKRS